MTLLGLLDSLDVEVYFTSTFRWLPSFISNTFMPRCNVLAEYYFQQVEQGMSEPENQLQQVYFPNISVVKLMEFVTILSNMKPINVLFKELSCRILLHSEKECIFAASLQENNTRYHQKEL